MLILFKNLWDISMQQQLVFSFMLNILYVFYLLLSFSTCKTIFNVPLNSVSTKNRLIK